MSSPRITFQLSGDAGSADAARLVLEQAAVPAGSLSLVDLANMLSMVRAGVSAKTYIAQNCPASIVGNDVVVPLTLFVWPSLPSQEYTLTTAIPGWTEIGPMVAVEQAREFDQVIPLGKSIDLPCMAADLKIDWQSPAITSRGAVIDPPEVSGYDVFAGKMVSLSGPHGPVNRIRLDSEVFGVLRIRCRALGYSHALAMTIPKIVGGKITDIKEVVTAVWPLADGSIGTASQDIAIPSCASTLLEACENSGGAVGDRGAVADPADLVPQIRYNTCTGQPIGIVRMVRP